MDIPAPAGSFWRKESCNDAREGEYPRGRPRQDRRRTEDFREEVQSALEARPGYKVAFSLHDLQNRHDGRTISITFWESEEHMHDNGEDHNRVLSKVAETESRELVGVEWYDAGVFEPKD
jgi:heme-degrading monooxygenase HmoA